MYFNRTHLMSDNVKYSLILKSMSLKTFESNSKDEQKIICLTQNVSVNSLLNLKHKLMV